VREVERFRIVTRGYQTSHAVFHREVRTFSLVISESRRLRESAASSLSSSYIHTHTHVYTYIYVFMYIYVHIYTHINIYTHTCLHPVVATFH